MFELSSAVSSCTLLQTLPRTSQASELSLSSHKFFPCQCCFRFHQQLFRRAEPRGPLGVSCQLCPCLLLLLCGTSGKVAGPASCSSPGAPHLVYLSLTTPHRYASTRAPSWKTWSRRWPSTLRPLRRSTRSCHP